MLYFRYKLLYLLNFSSAIRWFQTKNEEAKVYIWKSACIHFMLFTLQMYNLRRLRDDCYTLCSVCVLHMRDEWYIFADWWLVCPLTLYSKCGMYTLCRFIKSHSRFASRFKKFFIWKLLQSPLHKTSVMCTIISVYGYKCMYFVGVYCCGTEAPAAPISLCNWLGSYPHTTSFTFYILKYTQQEPQKFTESQEVWFFLVFGFRNEKQCQVKDRIFRRRKKNRKCYEEGSANFRHYLCLFL